MNINLQKNQIFSELRENQLLKNLKLLVNKLKTKVIDLGNEEEVENILSSIDDTKQKWINANLNFEHACDEDVINHYIYEIKACEAKYGFLLKTAKRKGIKIYDTEKKKINTYI